LIAVIQRVKHAKVIVSNKTISEIDNGLLILLGINKTDNQHDSKFLARKISFFRIFSDKNKNMNLSLLDIGGSALIVSQFTLCASWQKGNRPGFSSVEKPEKAYILYIHFIEQLKNNNVPVQCGSFGSMMDVQLINEGPITFVLDSREK